MSNNDSALHQPPPAPSPSPPPPPPPSSHHPFNVQLRKHLTATHKSADPLDSAALHDDAAAQSSPAAAGNNSAAGNASSDDTEFTRRWRSGPRYAADRRNSRSAENLPSMMLTAIGDRFGGNIGIGGVIRSASGSDGDGARRKVSDLHCCALSPFYPRDVYFRFMFGRCTRLSDCVCNSWSIILLLSPRRHTFLKCRNKTQKDATHRHERRGKKQPEFINITVELFTCSSLARALVVCLLRNIFYCTHKSHPSPSQIQHSSEIICATRRL